VPYFRECDAVQKRLFRSRRDHIIAGIAGGLGEYFDVDPTIVRLVMLLLVFPGGAGFLLYIIGWVIIPPEPGHDVEPTTMFAKSEALRRRVLHGAKQVEARLQGKKDDDSSESPPVEGEPTAPTEDSIVEDSTVVDPTHKIDEIVDPQDDSDEEAVGGPPDTSEEDERARRQRFGGFVLIGVGFLFVLRNVFPWISFGDMWPVFIIGLGVLLILRGLSE
jgi:phage shock protein C